MSSTPWRPPLPNGHFRGFAEVESPSRRPSRSTLSAAASPRVAGFHEHFELPRECPEYAIHLDEVLMHGCISEAYVLVGEYIAKSAQPL